MRSRAARLVIGAAAFLAIGGAAFFLYSTEQRIASQTFVLRTFDLRAREISDTLAELRVGQQAYVAEGQGVDFWMPKVTTLHESVTSALTALRQSPVSGGARTALDDAATTVNELANIDRRARDYINARQPLMAADVIFTEGGEAAATAARQIEAARQAEHLSQDAMEATARKNEAGAAGGAAALALLVIVLLVPRSRIVDVEAIDTGLSIAPAKVSAPSRPARPAEAPAAARQATVLKAAASLATDFGRVRDADEMTRLIGRAATLMDATGIVIWLGASSGAELAPMLAHGYGAQALSRMPRMPRSADNAAAAAYRTGQMQIVLAHPGAAAGALVAPILSADGCIGALSAEIQGGGEASDSVQSLATIVASHLASVLAGSSEPATDVRTAAQG